LLIELGFEGSVLKRPDSLYRPGRQAHWGTYRARHRSEITLRQVAQSREGTWYASGELDGCRVSAVAGAGDRERGESAVVTYSRVDPGVGLREARLVAVDPARTRLPDQVQLSPGANQP
jgi:hypothetical protein